MTNIKHTHTLTHSLTLTRTHTLTHSLTHSHTHMPTEDDSREPVRALAVLTLYYMSDIRMADSETEPFGIGQRRKLDV